MTISITNDFLHKYLLKAMLPLILRNRMIIHHTSTDEKVACLSFDCDVDEDMRRVPSLLDALHRHQIRTSFAVCGKLANKYPALVNQILHGGHEIVNHSFSHPNAFRSISETSMRLEIQSFQTLMKSRFDYVVRGFRAPHLMRQYNETFFRILREEGLYDSSYLGWGVSSIDGVAEVPLTPCPDHRQLCFDYAHHFQWPLKSTKYMRLWELVLIREPFVSVYLDPSVASDHLLAQMIEAARSRGFAFRQLGDMTNLES